MNTTGDHKWRPFLMNGRHISGSSPMCLTFYPLAMEKYKDESSVDGVFTAMSYADRGHLLREMHNTDKDIFTLDELTGILIDCDQRREDAVNNPEKVKTALHHRHLPKLEDGGFLEYDARNGDIRYRGTQDKEFGDLMEELNAMLTRSDPDKEIA